MSGSALDDPEFWNAYARSTTAVPAFLDAFARRALEEAALPIGSSILDIATGTGAVAIAAARAGMKVLATDFSATMVAHVEAHRIPGVETRQLDGTSLDLRDATFDAAFSNFGVSLFDDWRSGLREMVRVIKPGGVGSVAAWRAGGGAAATLLLSQLCADMFPALVQPPPSPGQAVMREPPTLRSALTSAGFVDIRIVLETNDAVVSDEDLDDTDRLFTFSPLWPQLDDRQRHQVVDAIRARGTPLRVPSPALIATSRRP